MDIHAILYLLAGLGTINGIVFGIYLLATPVGRKNANRFLGFFLILLSIRIFRSLHFYYAGLNITLYYIGHAAFFLSIPLIYFYFKATFRNHFKFKLFDLVHLVPLLTPTLTLHSFRYTNMIGFALFFLYLILSHRELALFRKRVKPSPELLKSYNFYWNRNLLLLLYAATIFYFLNILFRVIPYISGAVTYSFLLYLMIFYRNRYLQYNKQRKILKKYQTSGLSDIEAEQYKRILFEKIKSEGLYTDPSLTLNKLADLLSLPSYQLSQLINQKLGKNFTEFINQYRIEEAKRLLIHPDFFNEKIETIAYDSGFNTPSSFYAAFKKFTGSTPSQFKKTHKKPHVN